MSHFRFWLPGLLAAVTVAIAGAPVLCAPSQPVGTIVTIAGSSNAAFGGDGGPALKAQLNFPQSVAVDALGNLYIADSGNQRIRRIDPNGTITTVAGTGDGGFFGDGGPATRARLFVPSGVAVDGVGDLFIADWENERVRKVDGAGIITTLVGNGQAGFAGDDGAALMGVISGANGVYIDASKNLYIADSSNNRVRKIGNDGKIITLAGTGDTGFSGDGGPATKAVLSLPYAVVVDQAGNVLIADTGNSRIRKVSPNGTISTFAGGGNPRDHVGDGGPATSAALSAPSGLAMDTAGNVYIADPGNQRIRKVAPDGTITTIAGSGVENFSGDGEPATKAALGRPIGIAIDSAGNLYIADWENQRIREVFGVAAPGLIAGRPFPRSGDVNADGRVDAQDALLALRFTLGLTQLSPSQQMFANVTHSGRVTIADVAAILRQAVGL